MGRAVLSPPGGRDRLQGEVRLSLWVVVLLLAWLAVSSFGLPAVLGRSYWPGWWTPGFERPGRGSWAYLPALDYFSFPTAYWPLRHIAADALRHHRVPLWDPNSDLGLPLAARYEPQVFFPLEWPAILGGHGTWFVLQILSMVLAGLGTYLFLRRLRLRDPAALAGAILYMFSGFFLWFFTMPAFIAEAWLLPWVFLIVERCRRGDMGIVRATGASGVVIGLVLLAGQPEMAVHTLLACTLYVLFATLLSPRPLRRLLALLPLGIGGPLGLGAAAVQMALFREAVRVGYTLHSPGAYAAIGPTPLGFAAAVWPYLLGQPQAPWFSQAPGAQFFVQEGFAMVLGAFGLLAASAGVARLCGSAWVRRNLPSRDAPAWSLLIMLGLFVMPLMPTGGYPFFERLDPFKWLWTHSAFFGRINYPRYVVPVVSFSLAALGAVGVNALGRLTRRQLLGALVISLAIAGGLAIPVNEVMQLSPQMRNVPYMWNSVVLAAVPFFVSAGLAGMIAFLVAKNRLTVSRGQVALLLILAAEVTGHVRYGLAVDGEYLRFVPFCAAASCAVFVMVRRDRVIPVVLLCVPLATLVILQNSPYKLPKMQDQYTEPQPEYVRVLAGIFRADPTAGRVLPSAGFLQPNVPASMGIPELAAHTPYQEETTAWFTLNALTDKALDPPDFPRYLLPNHYWGVGSGYVWDDYPAHRPYYNLVGVRYIVDDPAGWWSRHRLPRVRRIYQGALADIYEDKDAIARAFAIYQVRRAPDLPTARKELLALGDDVRRIAVVEVGHSPLPDAALNGPAEDARPVHITEYSPTRVVLDAELARPALVVLTDAYYPGWNAAVDGRSSEVYRVDAIVRGVIVPPGRHQIVFQYWPGHFSGWLSLSAGAMLLCVLLCLPPSNRRQLARIRGRLGASASHVCRRKAGSPPVNPLPGAAAIRQEPHAFDLQGSSAPQMVTRRTGSQPGRLWIAELDGLRALAIISIVLAQFSPYPLASSPQVFYGLLSGLDRLSVAPLGLMLFFALSAFLSTYIGVREYDETGALDVKGFYARRCFRILPLYFIILAIDIALALRTPQWSWVKDHLWMFVEFLSNWSLAFNHVGGYVDHSTPTLAILWSIAVLGQFYLVFLLLLYAALRSPRGRWVVSISLIAVGVLSRAAFLLMHVSDREMGPAGGMLYATFTYGDVIVAGGAAGWIAAQEADRVRTWLGSRGRRGIGLLLLGVMLGLSLLWRGQLWYPYAGYSIVLYGATGAVLALGILWMTTNHDTALCRFLRSGPMRALGTLSYGIYLWHPISAYLAHTALGPLAPEAQGDVDATALGTFVLYLAITIAGAAVTYGLIERPFLALRGRFLSGRRSAKVRPQSPREVGWIVFIGAVSILTMILVWVGMRAPTTAAPLRAADVGGLHVQMVKPGDAVMTGAGDLFLVGGDRRLTRLAGREGQQIRVSNVGPWDGRTKMLAGLAATYRGTRWVLDTASMQPANDNSRFRASTVTNPLPGFWISPGDAGYLVTRLADAEGPFVRVQATKAGPYLVINGQGTLARLDGLPVSVRGMTRAHGAGEIRLTLYDVVAADGHAEIYMDRARPSNRWITLTVRASQVRYPDPGDNFSIGLFPVAKGDWFDVRELSMFEGTLP